MKARILGVVCCAFLVAGAAGAQTKISGTLQCAKPDPNYSIEVGDKPGHTLSLQKDTCKWAATTEINGLKVVDDSGVATGESWTTKVTTGGSRVATMENGDKIFVTVHDSSPVKDGMPTNIEGKWTFTGGTGKMKGIKGSGTYKVTPAQDGTASVTVEGEYTIAPPPAPKAATPKPKPSK